MASKRPKSHNVTRKLQGDAIHVSVARLRSLQTLIQQKGFDCLLSIQGIDSRYNDGMQECISYLLFGLLDDRKREAVSLETDDEVTDDLIICVKADSVDVYCNPVNYTYLQAYIAAWPDLHLYCLSQSQYEPYDDVAEEFKVRSFVSMMSKCKRVALSFFSSQQVGREFNAMDIEQWPIVQAYALEEYGSGTFFTLQHEVIDVSMDMLDVYGKIDLVYFQQSTLQQHLPVFQRQWDVLSKTVDVARLHDFSGELTQETVAEPLVTYFKHGCVGTTHTSDGQDSLWERPFVLMGEQTRCMNAKSSLVPEDSNVNISNAGPGSSKPLHMVCHGIAPKSGLVCTRTFFFDVSALPPLIGESKEYRNADVEQLSRAYKAAIEVTLHTINDQVSVPPNQLLQNAKKSIFDKLHKFMDCRKLDVEIRLERRRPSGSHNLIEERTTPQSILSMTVVIDNICSRGGEVSLGGVAFTESFLVSTIRCDCIDSDRQDMSTEVLNLTQNIPRWKSWNISDRCKEISNQIPSLISRADVFGEVLVDGQSVEIVSAHHWMQTVACTLHLGTQAIVLENTAVGPITLTNGEMKSVSFYDGGGPSVPAFVIIYTSMDLQTKLPIQLQNTSRMLVLSLCPRSRAYKLFYEQVFEAWKSPEEVGFTLTMENSLPDSWKAVHDKLTADFTQQLARPLTPHNGASQQLNLVGLDRFTKHLAASCCLRTDQVLTTDELRTVLHQSSNEQTAFDDKSVMLYISIISGIPGSYKENVANFITKLTQERCSIGKGWVIHKQTPETSHKFDGAKLENSLSYVYNALRKKTKASAKSSRMLIITPGFTDIQTVVRVIQNHPNKELRKHVTIGAVTTCIDPNNCYISGHHTLPGFLNQCALGWVNNIVLSSSSDQMDESLADIQSLARAVNPSVSFILTDKGSLTRSQDIELILSTTAFEEKELSRSRLLCPRLSHSSGASYGLDTVVLPLKRPIIRSKLTQCLHGLHVVDLGADVKCGTVLYVCGKTQFEGAEGAFEFTCATVSNTVKVIPVKQGETTAKNFILVTGFSLDESTLKAMLRDCAPPRPMKKEYITVDSLDKAAKNALHNEMHLEPLPSGWFYNGSQYMDMSGEKTDRHPLFDEFLQQHVDRENESIREFNNRVEMTDFKDLFD